MDSDIAQLIAKIIRDTIDRAGFAPGFARLLAIPLQAQGKVLAGTERPLWPAVVIGSAGRWDGDPRAVATVAAAVELFMVALDVLDDIEDDDQSPLVEIVGVAQALNVSTALLLLAQRLLGQSDEAGVPAGRVHLLVQALTAAGLEATQGQYLDLASEGRADLTTDRALDIVRRKAGALVGGACRLGALLHTDAEDVLGLYSAWGRHYGTMAQLSNDLHDAQDTGKKSDFRRGKGTLPLIFTATGGNHAPLTPELVDASGALHFTWVIFEIERQHGVAVLDQLDQRGYATTQLRALTG